MISLKGGAALRDTGLLEYYAQNYQALDVMYDFVQEYNKDMAIPKDYGTGDLLYTLEAHMLRYIRYNPGTTVSEISRYWGRNKATVSPQISKLEQKGYVRKCKDPHNSRLTRLYLTDRGVAFDQAHEAYDKRETDYFLSRLREAYTEEEIHTFYQMLVDFKELLSQRNASAGHVSPEEHPAKN